MGAKGLERMFFHHLKTIGWGVALLIAASSIHNRATAAMAARSADAPIHTAIYRVSVQAGQSSLASAAALQCIGIGY